MFLFWYVFGIFIGEKYILLALASVDPSLHRFIHPFVFFTLQVRRALGDFGVPISIVLMVTLDYLIHDTYTDKLTMPEGLSPSNPAIRGWLINPMGVTKSLPVWVIFLAAPASLLLFCLVFLEENICQ